ncbi:MAG: BatD family protein [Bacteroidota bacterium]
MKGRVYVYMLFFLLGCITTTAQVKFEAKVSKKRLGVNERLRVDFEMNQDGDNFRAPDFQGFRVVGGPNQSISNSWINGKRSYSKTYSFFLAPQGKGTFTIGQASIEVEGQIYKSSPIEVRVTEAVALSKDGNNADYLASENVHLVAELSNAKPYLNEAITVTYKLYVSYEVNITNGWREVATPKYADFWSQNIDNRGNLKIYEGKYKGEDYRYVILRTTVLYPQKTGELNIEPLTLDIPIDVRSNKRSLFGGYLMTRVNKTISAGNRTIQVKPLPTSGKPIDFTGAVGDFDFTVTTNKTTLDANESLELSVGVSGKGNLKLFDLPNVKLPSSLEVYEPVRNDNITTNASGMAGKISEAYTIVPQFQGNYPIRPISFSYFNPKTEKYVTRSSEEIIIEVEGGPVSSTNTQSNNTSTKQVIEANTNNFQDIALTANLQPIVNKPFFKSKLFWGLLGGSFLLIPLLIVFGNIREKRLADVAGNKLRRANALAKKYLSEAKKNLTKREAFYDSLERALHNFMRAKLHIETSEMAKDRIANLLTDRGAEQESVAAFIQLLKSCEFARYAGASSQDPKKDYELAAQLLSKIDKKIR